MSGEENAKIWAKRAAVITLAYICQKKHNVRPKTRKMSLPGCTQCPNVFLYNTSEEENAKTWAKRAVATTIAYICPKAHTVLTKPRTIPLNTSDAADERPTVKRGNW